MPFEKWIFRSSQPVHGEGRTSNLGPFALSHPFQFTAFCYPFGIYKLFLSGYHTLQGDNSLKSVERFDHMMFVCRSQASR
jgi:hypothetical protein